MIDARQKYTFLSSGAKLFAALLFVLCVSFLCQAQTVPSETCDFSKDKPFTMSYFLELALLEQAKPLYPAAGRNLRVQGKVRVKILVDRRGRVRAACAFDGHPLPRQAAEEAARGSRF